MKTISRARKIIMELELLKSFLIAGYVSSELYLAKKEYYLNELYVIKTS